jgi:hypothetical protein
MRNNSDMGKQFAKFQFSLLSLEGVSSRISLSDLILKEGPFGFVLLKSVI